MLVHLLVFFAGVTGLLLPFLFAGVRGLLLAFFCWCHRVTTNIFFAGVTGLLLTFFCWCRFINQCVKRKNVEKSFAILKEMPPAFESLFNASI